MKLEENDLPEFVRELRKLLGSLKGYKGLTETLSISYVVMVENEEAKENVLKVANLLTEQAAKNQGIDLEIVPATSEEMQEAAELYKAHQASKGSFEL